MAVTWRTFAQMVNTQIAAMVASTTAAIDTGVGSVTLALLQATSGVGLWLQGEAARIVALTRAATSTKLDLDSFYADFVFFRLGLVAAAGQLTFSRFTPSTQAVVPIGAICSTGPGGLQFIVTLDTANVNYDQTQGGYVLPINTSAISVPAKSLTSGTAGNVVPNSIQSFFQVIPGVDAVNNPAAFQGGINAETDAQYRARFPFYLAGLRSADEDAITSAILSIQPGVRWLLVNGYDWPGTAPDPGNFFVILDDGSGTPPASLLLAVTNAIQAVVALGVRFQVYAPTLVTVNVQLTIVTFVNVNHPLLVEEVSATISAWLNASPLGLGLVSISKLAQLAYETSSQIQNVPLSQILINGVNADLVLTQVQRPISGTVDVA